MSFAVMQPYLFPYLGYYQLVNAVDIFVFYDDVTFIKGGYINRNNILSNGKAQRFTIPVPGMSSNKLINDLKFDVNIDKTLKTIAQCYRKAPYFNEIYPLVEMVLGQEDRRVEYVCSKSISIVFEYLEIEKETCFSSEIEYCRSQPAAEKLIAMASKLNKSFYINSADGKSLYSKAHFKLNSVSLKFLEVSDYTYTQYNNDFIPNLSMIDVLMFNGRLAAIELLKKYRLV